MTFENEKKVRSDNSDNVYDFEYDNDIDPLELIGNASLSLHHHMAPPDEDLEDRED
jgi:hypothetical protein